MILGNLLSNYFSVMPLNFGRHWYLDRRLYLMWMYLIM